MIPSLLSLLYPPLCLSCEDALHDQDRLLCDHCSSLLELVDPSNTECLPFSGVESAFEYLGPAAAMVKKLKYGGLAYLAKPLAAFLVTQWTNLDWPVPDIVIPVPVSWDRKMQRGYNQSALIGQEFAALMKCSYREPLERLVGDYSQAGLSHHQRTLLKESRFRLKNGGEVQDKIVCIIDDVTTTGKTLEQCGRVLLGGHPGKIYGLTVCKTKD